MFNYKKLYNWRRNVMENQIYGASIFWLFTLELEAYLKSRSRES